MNAPATSLPPHVRREQVIDFDLYEDWRYAAAGSPHAGLSSLGRSVGYGIFWTQRYGGHWVINSHALLTEVLKRPDSFSSSAVASIPPLPRDKEPWLPPLSLDPPEHAKYRAPLTRAFSAAKIRLLEGTIRALARELIQALSTRSTCEFVSDIAEPFPIIIFMNIMGLDTGRLAEFRGWIHLMMSNDTDQRVKSYGRISEMMTELIAARRMAPRDDLISILLEHRIDGELLDDRQMQGICMLLFGAGLDTLVNALSLGMEYLARNMELQELLRRVPAQIPAFVEEVLRFYAGVSAVRRATLDVAFHGADIRKDDLVLLLLPMGNTDPTSVDEPDAFRLDRAPRAYMTFGTGIHHCVGSILARTEMKILFEEWLQKVPSVGIVSGQKLTFRAGMVIGLETLPLAWAARSNK